jgi:peptidoglycan/xylan/chitin deacetylase (PgdA/CDA1 family)
MEEAMLLPTHGRYDYSAITKRAHYDWPGGKQLAVHIAINIEHFAFGQGVGHFVAAEGPPPDHRNFAWRDYGNRVGVWRLLELLDELKLPGHHLANTALYDYCPEVFEPIRARGDEITGHGRTNAERAGLLWEEDERRLLAEVRATIARHEGKPPRGWMAPWMSASRVTLDLLKETGYDFVMDWPCDDQPFWMRTRAGPILSIPYPLEINDSPQMLVRHHSPSDFATMIVDQFEEMLGQSTNQPLVCGIALHTMVFGQPYRLRVLREALRHIVNHKDRERVWFTRPCAIYDHIASLPAGVVPGS